MMFQREITVPDLFLDLEPGVVKITSSSEYGLKYKAVSEASFLRWKLRTDFMFTDVNKSLLITIKSDWKMTKKQN